MNKKMYFEPMAEVIDLKMETSILTISVGDDSDTPQVIDGEGGTGDLG